MKRIELYHSEELSVIRTRQKRAKYAMIGVGAAGLAACVLLCVFATRENVAVMRPIVIGTSILAGWIVIFLSHAVYGEAKAFAHHDELMLSELPKRVSGQFEKTDDVRHVKNGVTVRKIRMRSEPRDVILNVNEQKAAILPDRFTGTVETVYDFITAFEVDGDA